MRVNSILISSLALLGALSGMGHAAPTPDGIVTNGDFTDGLVPGSMPAGSVDGWSLLTASPQVITDGCKAPGAVQMWGNLVVGESIKQQLPGVGFEAGKTYRVTVNYKWLDGNPNLPPYVRFRLAASSAAPTTYPPISSYDFIGSTPNTSSTTCVSYTFPDWTAPNDAGWLTVNPENDSTINDGNFVSWGIIDDICVEEACGIVSNGSFTEGLVPGSMPAGSVDDWSLLTASPQVVTNGCNAPGAVQMWGNLVVGESIKQQLPGVGFEAGKTYRVTVNYKWLDGNPNLPPYVRFRLAASSAAPTTYPPISSYDFIGSTPNTSSTTCVSYTFPDWTAPNDAGWLTVNPENDSTINDGNFVSWGIIDDICIEETCGIVANGDFTTGLVPGSMPSGSVDYWSRLTATPQVVTNGCKAPGAIQMWGNLVVGESIQQQLPGVGIESGKTYSVSVNYKWINNDPNLPQYVRFRLTASGAAPATYPPISSYDVIGVTPNTSSTNCVSYTFPNWTAPNDASWLMVNPENDSTIDDGSFVSWGLIDDICIREVECNTDASWYTYGTGWPGTNGIPTLTSSDEPVIGSTITLSISNSLGSFTPAFLLLGYAPTSLPTALGGTLLVVPSTILSIGLPASGAGLIGSIPNDAALCGFSVFLQVIERDSGASQGFSFTPGLQLTFGS